VGQELVGDDPGVIEAGKGLEALHGLLDHGAFAVEGEDLLGACAAGPWPEAGAAPPRENHRTKINTL
jgi:hypothetical protein